MIAELQSGATRAVLPLVGAAATNALYTTDRHARYQEAVKAGRVFSASNQAAQAISVGLATTYTGLVVSNPYGNTANFIMWSVYEALTVAPAAIASLHLIGGASVTQNTHTTPLAAPGIQNMLFGGSVPKKTSTALVDSAATVVSPGYLYPLANGFTAAALPNFTMPWVNIDGMIVLAPGSWIAIGALTAVTGFGGFIWEEQDITALAAA